MSWLRDNLVALLVAASVLMAVGTVSGWVRAAHHKGVAEAEAAQVERLEDDLEEQAARTTAAAQRAAEAERETQRVRESMGARIASLTAELHDLEDLNASLESAAEAEITAHDGWVTEETYRERVAALERTIVVTDSMRAEERAGRLQERARGDALEVQVGELMGQVSILEDIVGTQAREIDARVQAESAGGLLPDLGALTEPVAAIIGGAIGYGLGRLAG